MLKRDLELLLPALLSVVSVYLYLRYMARYYPQHYEILMAGAGALLGSVFSRIFLNRRR